MLGLNERELELLRNARNGRRESDLAKLRLMLKVGSDFEKLSSILVLVTGRPCWYRKIIEDSLRSVWNRYKSGRLSLV